MSNPSVTRPYFRFKRDALTIFVETKADEPFSSVKERVVELFNRDNENIKKITKEKIRFMCSKALDDDGGDSNDAFFEINDETVVGQAGIKDDQVVYMTLKKDDGDWEDPFVVDFDARILAGEDVEM